MRNILIAGAGSQIGKELAEQLESECTLYSTYRNELPADSENAIQWDATEQGLPADFLPGKLEGLVYCPGTIRLQPFERLDMDAFMEDLQVNFLGAVKVLQSAMPSLKAADKASVVLFSSVAASTGMRTGEIKQLKWGDIEIRNNETLVARVRPETSKVRRGRKVVAHSPNIIKVLDEYKKESKHTKDSHLVFYNEKKNRIGPVDLSKNFKTFLKNCEYENRKDGLLYSADGKTRTLYSLRHFYAIQRLKQNQQKQKR